MVMTRVLLGSSFACDDAIARPVEVLLQEVTRNNDPVDIEWLGYGSATDLTTLDEPLQCARVDLVVLIVRIIDLEAAHPELQPTSESIHAVKTRFLNQLHDYNQRLEAPPMGVLFCPSPPSSMTTYERQEATLRREIQSLQRVSCRSSCELLSFFSAATTEWYDARGDKREHAPFTQSMLQVLALGCVRQIARLWIRRPKKVIVLDCDNTLWGGAVADVGPRGVELSERFLALQQFVLNQQQYGILLCLCSKNIAEDVDAVFRERSEEMVLNKEEHIVMSKVNWRPKSHNIREIAQQLTLGLDTFVFVDDSAIECHEVASALPMVTVVHVPQDFNSEFLSTQWAFDTPLNYQPTNEDGERTRMYQQNAQRQELEYRSTSKAAFLSSLGIRIQCEQLIDVGSTAFARVLQLHQRTNTFNVATTFSRALTSDILAEYVTKRTPNTHFALTSTVTDRYGHYGLVCVSLFGLDSARSLLVVDSFLMSCRSLNRGVEHAMMKKIAEVAQEHGIDTIQVAWEPTVRNEPVKLFFASLSMSVFVATEGEIVTSRAEKIMKSATSEGCWQLPTREALTISFLREQQEPQERHDVLAVQWRAVVARLVKAVIRFVRKWIPHSWFIRMLALVRRLFQLRSVKRDPTSTMVTFRTHKQLDAFMRSALQNTRHQSTLPQEPHVTRAMDKETDEAFRLRARQATKLVLLDHVSSDAPRVVWAPQRSDDVRLDEDDDPNSVDNSSTDKLQQFHRPCATPSCSALVYWENECAFQRCRTCCYRVQRLLHRATNAQVHAKARAHASTSLASDFNVLVEDVEATKEWCSVHTNERRRK